jgi:2-hydroxyacyl-CoA lyase 1
MDARPGPVLVELPADVLSGRAPLTSSPADRAAASLEIDAKRLDEAAERLLAARRPLLVIGKGLRWANAFEELAELVERLSLPFVTSPIACGYIPDDHPLCCNLLKWDVQRQADLVLLLGARLDWSFRFGTQIAPEAHLIQIDIHAPQLGRNRAAQLAIHGDAGSFVRGLLARALRLADPAERSRWLQALQERRAQVQRERIQEAARPSARLSPEAFAHRLAQALPREAICILDANLVMAACERHLPAYAPLSRLAPGTSGCLGTGIPAGLAAKMQFPSRPVVVVCGDFAFGLSAMEMETAMRHGIPLVVVVANNDGNAGSLRQRVGYPPGYGERVTMFQPGIRYERIVEALGCHAGHVADEASLGPALSRALASGKPACLNVAVDPDAAFPRR